MESYVGFDCRPELRRPVIIEGLPGVGNVGKLVADLMAEQLGAKRMMRIFSPELPPQVLVDDECIANTACCEVWYADIGERDAVFILGDYQATTPIGQYILSDETFRMFLKYDPSLIVTLGGYGTGALVPAPRVLGAVSDPDMKPALEEAGVGFYPSEPQGGIVGAAAMFLGFGSIYGIPSVCIMGETSGYIVDYRSARNVLDALCNYLGIHVDASSYQEQIDQIDTASTMLASDSKNDGDDDDLVYIR